MAKIIWDFQAVKEHRRQLQYTYENWGAFTAKNLMEETQRVVQYIGRHPETGFIEPILKGRSRLLRAKTFKKHFKIIYFYDKEKDCVVIVDIWNTRMNPNTLAKRIE